MPNANKPIINDTPTLYVNVATGGESTFKIAKSSFSNPLNGKLEYFLPNASSGSHYDPKTTLALVNEDDEYLYFHVDATQQNTSNREYFNLIVSNGVEETSLLIRVAIGIAQDQQTEAQWDVVIAQKEGDHLTVGSFDEAYGSDGDDHFYYIADADPNSPYGEYATFIGGKGNDSYHVAQGQWVSINEVDNHNTLILGEGLRKEDMRVNTSGDSITLTFAGKNGEKDTTISLHHHDQRLNAVDILDKIVFANGDTLNGHDLGVVTQNYGYPHMLNTHYDNSGSFSANMEDLCIKDSKNLGNLANGLSTTPDLGTEITIIGATLANGDPLPDWLVLDPKTATFSGTMPKTTTPIHLDIVIHTINTNGVISYFDTSMYLPANWGMNQAPIINQTQQDLNFNEKSAWHYTIPTYLFRDPEYDRLTYHVTLADGKPLPAWMTFDPHTMILKGLAGNDEVGNWSIKIIATDSQGLNASQDFTLTINNMNDAPIVTGHIDDQHAKLGDHFRFELPKDIIIDIDKGDTLTYKVSMADGSPLPSWLSFAAHDGSIWGRAETLTNLNLVITTTDRAGESVAVPLTITVDPFSTMETIYNPELGTQFSYILGEATPLVTYSLQMKNGANIPDWVIFDPKTGTISGLAQDHGAFEFVITATDAMGNRQQQKFSLSSKVPNNSSYIEGNDRNNTLSGNGNGNGNFLNGLAGNDTLYGYGGDDYLMGGKGDDYLEGGLGNDTYIFSHNDGIDTINNYGADGKNSVDTIRFTNVKFAEALFLRSDNDLIITYARLQAQADDTGVITVKNHFLNGNYKINRIEFIDQILDEKQLDQLGNTLVNSVIGSERNETLNGTAKNDILYGFEGNDILNGGAGDDILVGGTGDDTLNGGLGNDRYVFIPGDGRDVINNYAADGRQTTDQIDLRSVHSTFAQLLRNGNDLIIVYANDYSDMITVKNHFLNDLYAINEIMFYDRTYTQRDIMGMLSSAPNSIVGANKNETLTGTAKNDVLYGLAGNDVINGGAGDDLLIGGKGNDSLNGGLGSDIYRFSQGDGKDTINNYAADGARTTDKVVFTDVSSQEITMRRDKNNLVILYGHNHQDMITVTNHFAGVNYQIKQIELTDRTIMASEITAFIQSRLINSAPVMRSSSVEHELNALVQSMAAFGANQGDETLLAGEITLVPPLITTSH